MNNRISAFMRFICFHYSHVYSAFFIYSLCSMIAFVIQTASGRQRKEADGCKVRAVTGGFRTAGAPDEFIVGGKQPLCYQQYKRALRKIQNAFDLSGYTAHDFRDTCATEWHEHGMPMDGIAKMLGHASSAVTEKHYVKFRDVGMNDAKKIMDAV